MHKQKILIGLFGAIIFIINSVAVNAVSNADGPAAEKAAVVNKCFSKFDFQETVSKSDAENEFLFGEDYNEALGYIIESSQTKINTSKLVASDETMECRSALGSTLQKLGTNYDDFFSKYYEKKDDNNDGQFNDYVLKKGITSAKIENDIKKAIMDADLWASNLSPGTIPTGYIKAVLEPLFNSCFKKSTQDSDFTINDQNYIYIGGDGKDARADRRVGLILDPDDGIWSCREIGEKLSTSQAKFGDSGSTLEEIVLGDAVKDEDLEDVPGQDGGGGEDGDTEQGANAQCMANSRGFGLAWIMCPLYNAAESAMNKLLNYLHDIMYTNLGESNDELKQAWGSLKNVANVLFVVALLLILIGQAIKGSW